MGIRGINKGYCGKKGREEQKGRNQWRKGKELNKNEIHENGKRGEEKSRMRRKGKQDEE